MTVASTVIIGGGPGGTGPLIWAAQAGCLDAWLEHGITLIERQAVLGGSLGRYAINSDTLGAAYLECVDAPNPHEFLCRMRAEPVVQEMRSYYSGFPPLQLVGRFMARLGAGLADVLRRHPKCAVHTSTAATAVHLRPDGSLTVRLVDAGGRYRNLRSRTAVMALGGQHGVRPPTLGRDLAFTDLALQAVMPSDRILSREGLCEAEVLLRNARGRHVVILGGSHSAYSVAWALTHLLDRRVFPDIAITILSRREPPVFYPDPAAASADGYAVLPGDICPRTGRVHRLGGLRGNGRDIWRLLHRQPGALPVRRLNLDETAVPMLRHMLQEAALVIPAFGYRSKTLPVYDTVGHRILLEDDGRRPVVDAGCRLYRKGGGVLPNIFGIGLGTGFRPLDSMGGEPNFDGQANSLWLYQNDIGAIVSAGIQQVLRSAQREASRLSGGAGAAAIAIG